MKHANISPAPLNISGEMQRQYHHMARDVATYKEKYAVAHDRMIAAETRAHDMRHRAKAAEGSLKRLEEEARRYLFLKSLGCEAALAMLKHWETDAWDTVIDKVRPR